VASNEMFLGSKVSYLMLGPIDAIINIDTFPIVANIASIGDHMQTLFLLQVDLPC
jgi:hypothetical protein